MDLLIHTYGYLHIHVFACLYTDNYVHTRVHKINLTGKKLAKK